MTTHTLSKEKKINGVDIFKLHGVIKSVKNQPKLGDSTFRIKNGWLGGDRNETTVGLFKTLGKENIHKKTFTFQNGEPEGLCGSDQGANPVEFVLHALAGCVTTTTVMHAAARGINIQKIETEIEGDLDLQGLFGISDKVQTGYRGIRVRMKIESDAEGEKLDELKTLYRYSPVFGTLTQPANVDVDVEA